MLTRSYSKEIFKRVLSDMEIKNLDEIYEMGKKHPSEGRKWQPTEKDWIMWDRNPRPSMEEWLKHWQGKIRSKNAVIERLGRMYLMENKKYDIPTFLRKK